MDKKSLRLTEKSTGPRLLDRTFFKAQLRLWAQNIDHEIFLKYFSVLVAEIVAHFLPKMVEIHNYSSASSQAQKLTNWDTLNSKCQLSYSAYAYINISFVW